MVTWADGGMALERERDTTASGDKIQQGCTACDDQHTRVKGSDPTIRQVSNISEPKSPIKR
ncbi:hypothetical protein GCM10027425_29320 [Alteromonas gracilis]